MEELDIVMNNVKPGKSPGSDGVLSDIFVYRGNHLKSHLLNIFSSFWLPGDISSHRSDDSIYIFLKEISRSE